MTILSLTDGTTTIALNDTLGLATTLIANCNALVGTNTIDVAGQIFTAGDYLSLGTPGETYELMRATNNGTAITGGFRYNVTREIDGAARVFWGSGAAVSRLGSGIITLAEWEPQTARQNIVAAERAGDGDILNMVSYRDVVESIPLLITGPVAFVAMTLTRVQAMLEGVQSGVYASPSQRVFLQARYDHDTTTWRSEVLAGRLVVTDPANRLAMGPVEAVLIVTRRWYWEDTVERAIALSSAVTTVATTDWCTVYNEGDTPNNRGWFQAEAAQVTGLLPAPVKVQVRNNHGSNRYVTGIYLINYVHLAVQNADVVVIPYAGSETAASQATTAGSEPTRTWRIPLPAGLLTAAGRLPMRPLVVFDTEPSMGSLVRGRIQLNASGAYIDTAAGEQQRVGDQTVVDCGAMPLLPAGIPASAPPMAVNISVQPDSNQTVVLYWILFALATRGTYRRLRALSLPYNIGSGDVVIDDGIDGLTYTLSGSTTYPSHRGYHDYLHAWPNRTQRFRLLVQWPRGDDEAGGQFQVKMSYRPRRLSV